VSAVGSLVLSDKNQIKDWDSWGYSNKFDVQIRFFAYLVHMKTNVKTSFRQAAVLVSTSVLALVQASCVTDGVSSGGVSSGKNPYQENYFHASSWQEEQSMMPPYKAVAGQVEKMKDKGTEATLIRAGKSVAFNPATLLQVLRTAKAGDVIRLGKGQYEIIGEHAKETILGSDISIEGELFGTFLTAKWVSFKAARLANLSLLSGDFTVIAPHRLWLENVRVVRSFDNRTAWDAISPKGSSVIPVMGGFIMEPFHCSGNMGDYKWNLCLKRNAGFGNYLSNSIGTISLNSMTLNSLLDSPELRPFLKEYAAYLNGGPLPKTANAVRAHKFLRGVVDSGALNKTVHYYVSAAEARAINDLRTASYVRMTGILEREFGAIGPVVPSDAIQQSMKLADKAMNDGRPMTALYHLQQLYSQNISPADRKTVQAQIGKARTTLAKQYGTAIDYKLLSHSEPDGLMHKSTKEQVEGRNRATLIDSISERFPIARIADEASARFKVSIQQTKNEFTNRLSNTKIEERTMLIEDPAIEAARQKAAGEAAWAKFQGVIANFDKTASAIETTARTNYEQRVRIEDAGSGKQMVWYEGKKNQAALNLSNPALKSEPIPASMIEVTATTKRYLYNNIINVAYSAAMTDRGNAIDKMPPFSQTQSWNFSCKTEITTDSKGGKASNSDCFGGTSGRGGPEINQIVMKEVFAKWVHSHYENRVIAENIHRLDGAAKSRNKAEIVETILLGRSLGIASSKEQEAILKDILGDERAFQKVLSVTTIQ
jgi:hypothetical protein